MDNNSRVTSSLKLSAVGLLSTLVLAPSLRAQATDFSDALILKAVWATQDNSNETGMVLIGVVAEHKYGVACVEFYLDGTLHSKVVQETFNPETGEYEFVLTLQPNCMARKCKISALVHPFGVGASSQLPDLVVNI